MNLNFVQICGGLTRDPSMRYLDSGFALVEMSLALNDTRFDSASGQHVVETTYVSVVANGWVAEEFIATGVKAGDEVFVLGRLGQREIEKRDGSKERKTRIEAATLTLTRHRKSSPASDMQSRHEADPWAT